MNNINLSEVWGIIAAVLAAIVLVSNAAEKVVRAWKAAKAPNDQQNVRIDALEEWRKEVDRKLNRDNDKLMDIESGNRVTQRALLALLDHGIDGNNIKQMQDAKEALQDHLINHN